MAESKKLISAFVILLVVAGSVNAFSIGGLIDWIKGLFGGGKKDGIVCNPPYMKLGEGCCLDSDANAICDSDEKRQTTTQPSSQPTTTDASTPTTAEQRATTTNKQTTTTIATNLKYETVTLDSTLVTDVDPVLTASGDTLIQPTRGGYLEFVDLASNAHASVKLSGDIVSGVDALALKSGKAVIPVRKGNGALDIVDIAGKKLLKTVDLSSKIRVDVDATPTPDETKILVATRQDNSNSYIEVIDMATNSLSKKINLDGDLKEGVDPVMYKDGKKAVVPTLKGTGIGSRASFIDIASGTVLKSLDVDGRLAEDVDLKLTANDEILLLPTGTPALGFLSIIEAKTMTIQKKLTLSGTLMESVDAYFLKGERQAYIPTYKGSQGYIDVIDIYGQKVDYSIKLTGNLVKGADARLTPDGGLILIPTSAGITSYLDVCDPSSGTLKATVKLSATPMESVDVQISEDGKTAYALTGSPAASYVDIIDIASAKAIKTIEVKGGLVADLDGLLISGTKPYAVSTNKATGYVTIIRNLPVKSMVCLTTGMGTGYVHAIDTSSNTLFGQMALPGNVVAGVDAISPTQSSTTPHFDEDMTMEESDQTVFTTTTHPAQTTTTTTWTAWSTTSTTIIDLPPQTPTTTLPGAVITPRCGDGYLSWSGTPGGGTEECDPNKGPYNNWSGARKYDCPAGLTCENCKCVGCGDGRLQSGEECDNNNKYSTANGQRLWDGRVRRCEGDTMVCSDCRCGSTCGGDLKSTADCDGSCSECEKCAAYENTGCYYCAPKSCSELPGGWLSSVRCDGNHEAIEYNPECQNCARCKVVCPEDDDYFRLTGCGGTCDSRLCAKVGGGGAYKDCYKCNPGVCGDGIVTSGEQCEETSDCPEYHACSQCQCATDCAGFCADQGANGYPVTNAGAGSRTDCANQATSKKNALAASCRAVCSAYAFMDGLTGNCCCADAEWEACLNCPCTVGVNCPSDCQTPLATCAAKL